jgi:2-polyprenyl-3-methyl-5-hydroxy-6-metoxy-1,4-benzoquinol methylase
MESLPRAYDEYFTHHAEDTDTRTSGGSGLAWRMINGYLYRRFGMHRQPYNPLGVLLFSLIEPWRLKLDYFGRHLAQTRYPKRGRLLDVGCGSGAFLLRAQDMGWDVVGCEPDREAVQTCRSQGLSVFCGDAFDGQLEDGSFDVVTMSHVIEHVRNPASLLRRGFDLLRPGGVLWLALPNPESIGFRTFGVAWLGMHVPYHLCIPTQSILTRWLSAAGFGTQRRVRRGAHASRHWAESEAIARRGGVVLSSRASLLVRRVLVDLLATCSTRWSEETVIVANKLGHGHGS